MEYENSTGRAGPALRLAATMGAIESQSSDVDANLIERMRSSRGPVLGERIQSNKEQAEAAKNFAKEYLSGLDQISGNIELSYRLARTENEWLNKYENALEDFAKSGSEEDLFEAATARGAIETLVESYDAKKEEALGAYISTLKALEESNDKLNLGNGPVFTEDKRSANDLEKLDSKIKSLESARQVFEACVTDVELKYNF